MELVYGNKSTQKEDEEEQEDSDDGELFKRKGTLRLKNGTVKEKKQEHDTVDSCKSYGALNTDNLVDDVEVRNDVHSPKLIFSQTGYSSVKICATNARI